MMLTISTGSFVNADLLTANTLDGCFEQVSVVENNVDMYPHELAGLSCLDASDVIQYFHPFVKSASCPSLLSVPCPSEDLIFCCVHLTELSPLDPDYNDAPFATISGILTPKKYRVDYVLVQCKTE